MLFGKKKKEAVPAPAPAPKTETYDFIVKSENESTSKAIAKYQKFWTDPEVKYDGMKLMEFKEDGLPGDKVYEYPPLDVDVRIEAFLGEDGSTDIRAYILDGDGEIYVGTAAKTKAKKILGILQDKDPSVSSELYGGMYWKMEDSGYVDDRWSEDLTVRVYLKYEV